MAIDGKIDGGGEGRNEQLNAALKAAENGEEVSADADADGGDADRRADVANAVRAQKQRLSVALTQLTEFAGSQVEWARRVMGILQTGLTTGGPAQEAALDKALAALAEGASNASAFQQLAADDALKAAAAAGLDTHDASAAAAAGRGDAAVPQATTEPEPLEPLESDAGDEAGDAVMTDGDDPDSYPPPPRAAASGDGNFRERVKYIPLRLVGNERQSLRLLEAALAVSEYTDKVDVIGARSSKNTRIHAQLCAILSGLAVAADYKEGQKLILNKDFKANDDWFKAIFEVGRRHKILCPEKMRSEYGKLMYLLQDSQDDAVQELLGFDMVADIRTVHRALAAGGDRAMALLDDPALAAATAEIKAAGRPRSQVQRDIATKERTRAQLARKYASPPGASEEVLLQCMYSIGDNNSFLAATRDPLDAIIGMLETYFHPTQIEVGLSLAISVGNNGARLSHSHERQYHYVRQSLTLWREIMHDMYSLWWRADHDLLHTPYRLYDTGQGLNRVQPAHSVGVAIHGILQRCQSRLGSWVGSSVVHLGDNNVPNALLFIDKYSQVPRILNPIVLVIREIDALARDPGIGGYIGTFGGPEELKKLILLDFFRYAFDGSGADNFFDAGSCIDGRLTSAWNWCSKIEKKPYFPVFKLAGFNGFDGDYQK